jgi:hypothetical protein
VLVEDLPLSPSDPAAPEPSTRRLPTLAVVPGTTEGEPATDDDDTTDDDTTDHRAVGRLSSEAGMVERSAWSLVWLGVIVTGLDLWSSWTSWAPDGVVAPAVVLAGVVGLAASWVVASPRSALLQWGAMSLAVVSPAVGQAVNIHTRQFYATDSAAFDHVAARFLSHGVDPYTASMASAARLLQTPSAFWTYTVAGGHVTRVSYPAGSFLLELPSVALGFTHEIVDWTDLVAWVVTGFLIFLLLPRSVRWVAALLMLTPFFANVFGSGGTDAAFLPFLVLAVWRWDRYGLGRSAGVASWLGPVALGLACSIKQTPWFCVPFLVVALFLEARGSGRRPLPLVGRYLAVVVGVFLVVNAPFIVWSPRPWARGVLLPFTGHLVADGQGLVTVVLHGIARGVSFELLTVAGVLVLIALVTALVVWYPTMKRIWMLVLPLTFFVATRSLSTYLLDLYPAALVAAVTVGPARRPAPAGAVERRGGLSLPVSLAAIVPALAGVAVAVAAFVSPPLQLSVRSVASSSGATTLDAVTVTVHNSTDRAITPHFMVAVGAGHPDGFWTTRDHRPVVVAGGATTTVTLVPGTYAAAPAHDTHWLVEAYTTSPQALSTTPLLYWTKGKPPHQEP